MAAERAAELSDKEARVVPCTSQQAGLVALVEHDPARVDRGKRSSVSTRRSPVSGWARSPPAARDDTKGRFVKGDAVGFVGDEIVAWGGAGSTLAETLAALAEGAEIVTVIGGAGAPIPLEELSRSRPVRGRARAARRRPAALLVVARRPVSLLEDVIDAHGGRRPWRRAEQVRAHVRSGGLLMRSKLKGNRFRDYGISIATDRQNAVFQPFPRPGKSGVFDDG